MREAYLWKVILTDLIGFEPETYELYVVAENAKDAGETALSFAGGDETPDIKSIEFVSLTVLLAKNIARSKGTGLLAEIEEAQ